MKYWKILITSLLTISFIFLIPLKTSLGCGYDDDDFYLGYRFLSQNIMEKETEFSPYLLSFSDYHLPDDEASKKQKEANLEEWQLASCEDASLGDIEELIYSSTRDQLELLKRAAKKGGEVPQSWSGNYFVRHLINNKCYDTFEYLHYAKKCEPHVTAGSSWEEEPILDDEIKELIELGNRNILRTDNQFLRMRYMYQIVRLAHYSDQFEYALELYDFLDPKVDDSESIIKWWLLGHKAGCLKRLGKNVEASYLFSKVFKNSPSKREQVYRSFYIKDDAEWKACLLMCNSDDERATLHALRAMDSHADIEEEMSQIYDLFPASEHLTPLLIREISSLEETFLGSEFRRDLQGQKPDKIAKNRLIKLLDFVTRALKDNKIKDVPLWTLAQGYLEYLSRDLYAANHTYKKAETLVKGNPVLEDQLELFQLALNIHGYTRITPSIEEEISAYIKKNKFFNSVETFPHFLFDRLSYLYKKQKNTGKGFLCNFGLEDLRVNPKLRYINDLIRLAERENHNEFEEYLLKTKLGEDYLSELYELKGTYHLSKYELAEALRAFEKVQPSRMDDEIFSPFLLPILDCIHCESPSDTTILHLNKMELAKLLLEYEYNAKTDMDNADKYYYRLGSAFYNMSYYGHSFEVLDYNRSSDSWNETPEEHNDESEEPNYNPYGLAFGNKEYTNVTNALFFFDKCKDLTKDDELAARASFMAAKCELAKFYQDKDSDYNYWTNEIPKLPEKYRNYYDILKNKYSKTEFYQEAISECKFFAYYVEKGW